MRNRKKAASARREQTRAHTEAGSRASRPAGEHAALRFLPERRLGVGGLCEVHAARDLLRLEYDDGFPQVAVKCLRAEFARTPAARRLLAREFFVVRHVSHPGVVRVHDLHEEKGRLYLSMELLSGRTLYDLQGQHPAGLGAAVIPLARQLFRSLSLLHGLGIAHGDIKPANLMLERDDRLVLFDFNTAEVLPQPGRAASPVCQSLRSRLGLTAYSLLHASPERLEGCPPSFADDVCSTASIPLPGVRRWKPGTPACPGRACPSATRRKAGCCCAVLTSARPGVLRPRSWKTPFAPTTLPPGAWPPCAPV